MKYKFTKVIILVCLISTPAYAGGWNDFARGFAETSASTLERRKCEKTYSPSMCAQMEADKEEKEARERHNRNMEAELSRQNEEIYQLKQQQYQRRP